MTYKRISSQEARKKMAQPGTILVDIRDMESFRNGHVKDAIHLAQGNLPKFLEQTDRAQPVLVMCYHGNSSQMVADLLSHQGFVEVYSIDGGYEEWVRYEGVNTWF